VPRWDGRGEHRAGMTGPRLLMPQRRDRAYDLGMGGAVTSRGENRNFGGGLPRLTAFAGG